LTQICELKNPNMDDYIEFKRYVLSNDFVWYYSDGVDNESTPKYDKKKYTNIPFYSYSYLWRPMPQSKYPTEPSNYNALKVSRLIENVLNYNNITINCFLRIAVNAVHPQPYSKIVSSVPHFDHEFPHKNIIIYLTGAGGKTFVGDVNFDPKEDNVFLFEGEHYMQTPQEKRRVVLVSTFI